MPNLNRPVDTNESLQISKINAVEAKGSRQRDKRKASQTSNLLTNNALSHRSSACLSEWQRTFRRSSSTFAADDEIL